MSQFKDELLRQYLARLKPGGGLEGMVESAPSSLVADPAAQTQVTGALEKLALGNPLSPQEHFFIEALIIPEERPAIDIVDGDYHVKHPRWLDWNDDHIRTPLRAAFRSVGRIELPGHPSYPYGGSGFVVGDGLLMTNRHVAQLFCSGLGLRGLDFIPGLQAGVDFLRERGSSQKQFLRVVKTVMIHPHWDMALLQVEGLLADQMPLVLDTRDPAEHEGKKIAVIGYPAFDTRNDAAVQNQLFGGVYGVKRLMPGLLGPRLQVSSFGNIVNALCHDSSTLGGASGSTVFDPESGLVFGLHFGGRYLESNYAVPAFELARDSRVVDAGVKFNDRTFDGPSPWAASWQGNEHPAATVLIPPTPVAPILSGSTSTAAYSGEQIITIPLQISVRLGGAQLNLSTPQPINTLQSTPAVANPAASAPMTLTDESQQLLNRCQALQRAGDARLQRFVLNFSLTPDDDQLRQDINVALGLTGRVGPIFQPDTELDRHRLLELPGLVGMERDGLFDVARLLRQVTGADSVDPDLASDYFLDDACTPSPGIEGIDFPFWCWADDEKDLPDNPDWAMIKTHTPGAWAFSEQQNLPSRGEGIRIFQPDTGVVRWHSELPEGLENDSSALNLIEPGNPPVDTMSDGRNRGHGTGTASVVVSPEAGNMRGAAPRAKLIPVRCLETVAVFNQSKVAQAIDHARRSGAHVITMSLGGVFSDALHAALRKAVEANIIVLAAAGNCVGTVVWPARYEEAIAVGGINEAFQPWRGSSHGAAVDISGPAEFVQRASASDPKIPGLVTGGQGTSFATAHLAGVAALWLAHHGRDNLIQGLPRGVSLQQLFRNLAASSAQVPEGFDRNEFGAGIVNAEALLKLDLRHALTQESVFQAPTTNLRSQVVALVSEALGSSGIEAVAMATGDPQNLLELSCTALDQLRLRRSQRAQLESLPPLAISSGLRQALGARWLAIGQIGGLSEC
jgi:lambda repressor-like predicted transcriptional regulator